MISDDSETRVGSMFNADTELLFPSRVLSSLRGLRGKIWDSLVDEVVSTPPNGVEMAAFVLMMVRLGGCSTCNADSFRAMRGCTQCARQTVKRFRGSDEDLVVIYHHACQEVERFLNRL
jgi:hypothetical protein